MSMNMLTNDTTDDVQGYILPLLVGGALLLGGCIFSPCPPKQDDKKPESAPNRA